MLSFTINPDALVQLIVGTGSMILAFLLMLIKIPHTEYSSKLSASKLGIVVSLLICSMMMIYSITQYGSPVIWDWNMFTMMMIYIVVHFSTAIISYSMISLLRTEKHRKEHLFLPGLFASAVVAFALMEAYETGSLKVFYITGICAVTIFLIQWVSYIIHFDKSYKRAVKDIESYYDEDEGHRIKWVRFCYLISMLTNIFFIVYLCLFWFLDNKYEFVALYTLWYLIYFLYITANYITFLSTHRIVLEAVAHKALTGQGLKLNKGEVRKADRLQEDYVTKGDEYDRLELALKDWVARKRFCDYDKSRDDIAAELNTTKEALHHYFVTRKGVDFMAWRTELRIEEAKKMLIEKKDFSINIIGEMAGFSDRSNFHRQFVKLVGCSPRQWRESGGKI